MSRDAAAKDFVTDAFAHCKFIGVGGNAEAIFVAAGISEDLDEACLPLAKVVDAVTFIEAFRQLRFWPCELFGDLDPKPDACPILEPVYARPARSGLCSCSSPLSPFPFSFGPIPTTHRTS